MSSKDLTNATPAQTAPGKQQPSERALPPFDSIYFDTEPLIAARWPRLSVKLDNVASLAKGLNISLHVPEVAYLELEAFCLADYETERKAAVDKTSKLRSRLKMLGGDPSQIPEVPDVQKEMRDRYVATVDSLRPTFLPSPIPEVHTYELLKMAITYDLAFERGDKGFKDTLMFLSIVEEVKRSPKTITAVFVSKDNVFRDKKEELEDWAKSNGASVVLCPTLEAIEDALTHRQTARIQAQIESDRKALEAALNQHLADIQDWLDQNIESFNWQRSFVTYPTPLEFNIYNAKVLRLLSATPQYNLDRTDGERVRLSLDIEATLLAFAVVEVDPAVRILAGLRGSSPVPRGDPSHSFGALLEPRGLSTFPFRPMVESFDQVLEIEGEATIKDGGYTDFKFLTAKIKQPSLPPLSLLK